MRVFLYLLFLFSFVSCSFYLSAQEDTTKQEEDFKYLFRFKKDTTDVKKVKSQDTLITIRLL